MRKTAFICDESYFWHDTGSAALALPPGGYIQPDGSAESPESKRRFKNLLERSGVYDKLHLIKPYPATEKQLKYFHTSAHIDRVKHLSKSGGGDCGVLAVVGNGSYEIAALAAGGAIAAVEAVVKGTCDNAYALTRPPGHHAEADRGMGYCIFNNAAIAALYARKELGLERVMVIDWDVHHGNGTEDAFYKDPNVLFVSLHQENYFPVGRGEIGQIGEGAGKGTTLNIPLPAGTGDAGYMYALEEAVKPVADRFKPQLIIISAGQDANIFDPLARMMVTVEGYRRMTKFMRQLAEAHCGGKLVALHEGGYSTSYVPFCSHAVVEEMSGIETDVGDPFHILFSGTTYNTLSDYQKARVDEVKAMHKK
ncbi:MAG: class II histone deacetylase [Treponema sp.]|nr:class II histone deacetylase [Treponema sp.]